MSLSLAEKLFGAPLKQIKSQNHKALEFEKLDEMPPFSPQEQKILAEFLQSIPAGLKLNDSVFFSQTGSLELSYSISKHELEERISRLSREDAEEIFNLLKRRSSNAAQ